MDIELVNVDDHVEEAARREREGTAAAGGGAEVEVRFYS
jgi:hypothetical protein